jgi:hypothetical protein
MHRGYIILIVLILSSLACGFIGTATAIPTNTNFPTEAVSTQALADTPTKEPAVSQNPKDTPPVVPSVTQKPVAKATSTPTQEEPTKTPYPTSVLDSQLSQELNQIQSKVIEMRGLQPKESVPVVLLSPEELRQNVINDFLGDYTDEEITNDVMELSTIGLIEPDFDFKGFYTDLLSEQVAGYYDPEMKEMFIVQGQSFQGPEQMTYAHEYTHALQDQNYDIRNGLNQNDETCDADSEYCGAVQALLEGDASLSEAFWYYYADDQTKQQIDSFYSTLKSPVYESAPAFMKEDFLFPYNQGASFVMNTFEQGGWSAVDKIYKDPPVSTEQILHPDLYPSDTPIPVDLPELTSVLGDGWREVSRNQMGEWYTYLILARAVNESARLDDTTAQDATAGWGGDEYLVLHNDATDSTAFVMKTVWDTPKDAEEFATALQQYADIRFDVQATQQGDTLTWSYPSGYSSLYRSGDTTIWIIAPDSSSAETITSAVQP